MHVDRRSAALARRDARAAGARHEEAALRRVEHGMAVGLIEQGARGAILAHRANRVLGHFQNFLAALCAFAVAERVLVVVAVLRERRRGSHRYQKSDCSF
jgi:hypothetical protein